jgi:hypothetical protein
MISPPIRIRILALTALLAISACSAEPDADPADQTATASESTNEAAPTQPDAFSIRIVNLWVDSGQPAPVDIVMRPLMGKETPLFEGVQPGTVTDLHGLPTDVQLDVYRMGASGSEDDVGGDFITETDIEPSSQLTLVLTWTRPLSDGGNTAQLDIFFDSGEYVTGTMPARPVRGALLVAFVSPLNRVLAEDDDLALTFGIPGQGCLLPAGSTPSPGMSVSAAATAAMGYDLPPGTHAVAAWPSTDMRCEGDPLIGPVDVTAAAGHRSYLFAWGTGTPDMRLLAVPPRGK